MPKRILEGVVVSDKGDKTVVVKVERTLLHPVLKKIVRLSKKYHAHDEGNALKVGDVARIVESCAELGVSFALDDFGTGYCSLAYLKRLPHARLKIDQLFVRDMLIDPEDRAILEAVVGLAKAFRRGVVAEGVETAEQGSALLELGCEVAQGFGIARPMPAEHVPLWLSRWQPPAAWSGVGAV